MSEITILGAGAMGSALATPLTHNGHHVKLWGTHLDHQRIDALRSGAPHPGTGVAVPPGVSCFRDTELAAALRHAAAVIIAVSSVAVHAITAQAAAWLDDIPILIASKGFHRVSNGTIVLMPDAVRDALGQPGRSIVAIGGPCKADEVAAARTTATLYAALQRADAAAAAALLSTEHYLVEVTDDERGLEICAPLKNVYAIALGYVDGLQVHTGQPWHNFRSALFARAVSELAYLAELVGGRASTATGLAGVGDLEVTGLSGRNKVFGYHLGSGKSVDEARAVMAAADLTVEGVPACELGTEFSVSCGAESEQLSLLHAIRDILDGAPPLTTLQAALVDKI